MKFQPDTAGAAGINTITRHEPGRVFVGATAYGESIVVPWTGAVLPWSIAGFDTLQAAHFDLLLTLKPELVIFGSGARMRFAHPRLFASLINAGIGVETMDTGAACRTYNVLVSESRSVVAALLVEV